MLIAHLADLHLGYRAYHRLAPGGANQRERDVSDAVARVITQVIESDPDLVVVAGDVFHSVRPSNAAITDGFRHFMRLRRGLPRTPVVMIAGNHDAPRVLESGNILRLLAEIPDVHVVDDAARRVRLEGLATSVLCLPHAALAAGVVPALEPDPEADLNVLVAHGTVTGAGIDAALERMAEYGGVKVDRAALRESDWDYVALGHYHNATRIAPNVWYAGAPERTTTNVWAEADSRKGWVLFDTATGAGDFREVQTRDVVELPGFSARVGAVGGSAADGRWRSAEDVDRKIREAVDSLPGGVAGRVVRLVITDLPRDLFRQLDHRQIRALKAEALHFQLEARRPSGDRSGASAGTRRRTLEEEVQRFLAEWQPTTPGIEQDRLLALGAEYLGATPPHGPGSAGSDPVDSGPDVE